jgi:hypothetical protein
LIQLIFFFHNTSVRKKLEMAAPTYKPNGGVLGCPRILASDFGHYSDAINSTIDADGRLKRVPVAKLTDKEWDNDYDVYVETNPDKVSIINAVFGPSKSNLNGMCYSVQIGNHQTDVIDLQHPQMGSAFYSASAGLLLCFLLKNSPYKIRATDLCCSLNGHDFIISTDANEVYAFLGIDLTRLLQMHTRQELFALIEQSWLYDPELILSLQGTKTRDIERPIFVDFMAFCQTHPRRTPIEAKLLDEVLCHFGKTDEFAELKAKQEEEARQNKMRSKTKEQVMDQFKKNKTEGKELGKQMNAFKEWIFTTFAIEYDKWAVQADLNIEAIFQQFLARC